MIKGFFVNLPSEKKNLWVSRILTTLWVVERMIFSKWCSRQLWIFVASRMSQKKNNNIKRIFFSFIVPDILLPEVFVDFPFLWGRPKSEAVPKGCLRSPQTTGKLIPKKWKSMSNWVLNFLNWSIPAKKHTKTNNSLKEFHHFRDIPIDVTGVFAAKKNSI